MRSQAFSNKSASYAFNSARELIACAVSAELNLLFEVHGEARPLSGRKARVEELGRVRTSPSRSRFSRLGANFAICPKVFTLSIGTSFSGEDDDAAGEAGWEASPPDSSSESIQANS
eukprot:CAMPEP_0115358628 /NCGR_PEP_ID=MMETSP0270-20121206/100759_1 /TAXON_ID=71861 /ORGANISM="Scrippsiella trochoidea, Strain CCMP3099" /LENGTH=116 /DNA_ID=CAMNT_0002781117 /DNA_START=313 /DNA_END=662 /DNA_ORIENTATION=+